MLSAPAGLIPASVPVEPGVGLWNWPPPTLPSGPAIELPGPTDGILHDVIFCGARAITIDQLNHPVNMVIEKVESTAAARPATAEVRVIDVAATVIESAASERSAQPTRSTIDHVDPITAEVTSQPADLDTPEFAYGNSRLSLLPPSAIAQLRLQMERLMDNAINYLLGEQKLPDFRNANTSFTFALQTMKGDPLPKRSPAQSWDVVDSPNRIDQKRARLLKLLHECVSPTIAADQIVTLGRDYYYSDDEYRYVFREWYRGDALIVQLKTSFGYTTGRMAFKKMDVEAARIQEKEGLVARREETERSRSPFGKARPDSAASRIDDLNMQVAQNVYKHQFAQKASGANG